jgi:predicted phosphodiesterase
MPADLKPRRVSGPRVIIVNVVTARRRVMAVGCSHGNRANPNALAAALLFREQFRPDEVIHLGDAYDLASLRAGALANPDDSDHADDYLDDIRCGVEFLDALRPTVFIVGNHDLRALKYTRHHNTVVRGFAEAVWQQMVAPIERHARVFIKHHDVLDRSWYRLGGFRWGHGILFGENFLRDSAETWGDCVVAHAHRAGMATGRTESHPVCLSPGTLADAAAMDYALRRRSTLAWSHGIVFGEFTDDSAQLYVHQWSQGETQWNLPNF